jgi:hypothetical protein
MESCYRSAVWLKLSSETGVGASGRNGEWANRREAPCPEGTQGRSLGF